MNPNLFKLLPALLPRADVVECGIPNDALDDLRHEIRTAGDSVPFGKIGAIRGLHRNRRRKGRGNFLYRKMDIAPLLGSQYL